MTGCSTAYIPSCRRIESRTNQQNNGDELFCEFVFHVVFFQNSFFQGFPFFEKFETVCDLFVPEKAEFSIYGGEVDTTPLQYSIIGHFF